MPKKAKVSEKIESSAANTSKQTKQVRKAVKRKDIFSTFPVPRRVLADPELTIKYTRPGYLHFVHGNDKRFLTQALDWSTMWPDAVRPYYDEEERRLALPTCSWPPNFVMLAPEQQFELPIAKPVHGGWTWPGHAPPKLPTIEGFVQSLPGPLKKFFS